MNDIPKAPQHLGKSGRQLWQQLHEEYELEGADLTALLEVACTCVDRLDQARQILKKEGPVAKDRYGSPKAHPALQIEKDARAGLIAAFRAMDLDPGTEQNTLPRFLGRPPGAVRAN